MEEQAPRVNARKVQSLHRPPPSGRARRAQLSSTPVPVDTTRAGDLSRVHTVPDPLYVTSGFQTSADTAVLGFVNLPSRAIIRIYSVSGILVAVLSHDDVSGGGETAWNLRSRNGRPVASGVYFYHVEATGGHSRVGRFTVITHRP